MRKGRKAILKTFVENRKAWFSIVRTLRTYTVKLTLRKLDMIGADDQFGWYEKLRTKIKGMS